MNKMKKEIAEIKMLMLLVSSNQIAKFVLRSISDQCQATMVEIFAKIVNNFSR